MFSRFSRLQASHFTFAALIEPAPDLTDREARQQSRLLLIILITLLVTSGIILLTQVLTNPGALDDFDFWATVVIWCIGLGLYVIARTGHTQIIAACLISMLFILTTIVPLTADSLNSLPFYGVIPIQLTAIFFAPRRVLQIGLAVVIVLTLGYILKPPIGEFAARMVIESILFTLPVGGVIWTFTWQRQTVERIRREELQTAYDQVVTSEAQLEERVTLRTRELLESQAALRASEAHHQALLRAIPDVIILTDRNGNYLDYHIGQPQLSPIALDQLPGQNAHDLHLKEVPDEIIGQIGKQHLHYIQEALDSNTEITREFSVPLQEQIQDFEVRIIPSGDNQTLTIIRNTSERKKLQMQTLALIAERERIELLNRFVQNFSHELRTPLTVISTSLYLLSRSNDPDKRQEYARRSEEQIVRTNRLLGMILSMTRLNSGAPIALEETLLIPLLEQSVNIAQEALADKQIQLEFVPGSTMLTLQANGEWLREAFSQLLDNAIRFTLEGGRIRLAVTEVKGGVEVAIQDTGIGITEADLPHTFEHFWRQDNSHSTPGFGLGLTLAQKIVQLHGGEITLSSIPQQGTTVRVFLPMSA